MNPTHVINVDLARVWETSRRTGFLRMLAWGDAVEVREIAPKFVRVAAVRFVEQADGSIKPEEIDGFLVPPAGGPKPADIVLPREDSRVLKVNFVDVQQGDGSVIETPEGKVVLIDGGDNQLFARYLAGRFRDTSAAQPQKIDCILVTHGDADHFLGLTEIYKSETFEGAAYKRLFIRPERVYHNGLVKRPTKVGGRTLKETEMLGATVVAGGKTILTELESDLLAVPDEKMNQPFRQWKAALRAYSERGPIAFRRLAQGDHDAFDFLRDENIDVQVLGPILTETGGVRGLRFLGNPPKDIGVGHESENPENKRFTGFSASHTINGHSVILRLTYGDFRFLFAGDLNEEAEIALTQDHEAGRLDLRSEVFKVPHHGSADFSTRFVRAVAPVVSVVSSGDENARKEFIHPRATLMGSLGRFSRIDQPLIFVTELVAFFNVEGFVVPERHVLKNGALQLDPKAKSRFFAFSRTAFGLVKMRTDGKRLLVYTDSGNVELKEAYAYSMEGQTPRPERVRQA